MVFCHLHRVAAKGLGNTGEALRSPVWLRSRRPPGRPIQPATSVGHPHPVWSVHPPIPIDSDWPRGTVRRFVAEREYPLLAPKANRWLIVPCPRLREAAAQIG